MNSNFRDESIEEGFQGNVADHLGNEDDSVGCNQRTVASIEGTPADQYILLSPIISDSPVSEPNLPMFCDSNVSDYCIKRLFDSSHISQSDASVKQEISTPYDEHFPTRKKCTRHFPRFWVCNVRGGTCTKLDEITEILVTNKIDIAVLLSLIHI